MGCCHFRVCPKSCVFRSSVQFVNQSKAVSYTHLDVYKRQAHLDPTSFQCMNARLAFQLFSNSIANTIKFYRDTNCEGFVGSEKTESFSRDMNDLVDALHSSIPMKGLYNGSASHHILLKVLPILNSGSNTFALEGTLESLKSYSNKYSGCIRTLVEQETLICTY